MLNRQGSAVISGGLRGSHCDPDRHLARHGSRGWSVAGNADIVAILTGADIDHQAVVDEYRAQRRAWHDRLGIIPWPSAVPAPPANGPPNAVEQALRLLEQMLGAEEIAA